MPKLFIEFEAVGADKIEQAIKRIQSSVSSAQYSGGGSYGSGGSKKSPLQVFGFDESGLRRSIESAKQQVSGAVSGGIMPNVAGAAGENDAKKYSSAFNRVVAAEIAAAASKAGLPMQATWGLRSFLSSGAIGAGTLAAAGVGTVAAIGAGISYNSMLEREQAAYRANTLGVRGGFNLVSAGRIPGVIDRLSEASQGGFLNYAKEFGLEAITLGYAGRQRYGQKTLDVNSALMDAGIDPKQRDQNGDTVGKMVRELARRTHQSESDVAGSIAGQSQELLPIYRQAYAAAMSRRGINLAIASDKSNDRETRQQAKIEADKDLAGATTIRASSLEREIQQSRRLQQIDLERSVTSKNIASTEQLADESSRTRLNVRQAASNALIATSTDYAAILDEQKKSIDDVADAQKRELQITSDSYSEKTKAAEDYADKQQREFDTRKSEYVAGLTAGGQSQQAAELAFMNQGGGRALQEKVDASNRAAEAATEDEARFANQRGQRTANIDAMSEAQKAAAERVNNLNAMNFNIDTQRMIAGSAGQQIDIGAARRGTTRMTKAVSGYSDVQISKDELLGELYQREALQRDKGIDQTEPIRRLRQQISVADEQSESALRDVYFEAGRRPSEKSAERRDLRRQLRQEERGRRRMSDEYGEYRRTGGREDFNDWMQHRPQGVGRVGDANSAQLELVQALRDLTSQLRQGRAQGANRTTTPVRTF